MAEVAQLVERFRADGLDVELRREGEHVAIPAGPDLAAYRVLQQALGAAASAGAHTAAVTIHYEPEELQLEVSVDRPGAALDAERLMAMRERLGLYGGRVRAADEDGPGFRLQARLPLDGGTG
jgi:signal transduction histidine kinase